MMAVQRSDPLGARADVVVIGAGIVGLAAAHRLLARHPGHTVLVVDKEPQVAAHQSSHNSGVLHAGVYYPPGSLKARLCRDGKAAIEAFAAAHGIAVEVNGKVVVARDRSELAALAALTKRAAANGVPGLREVDGPELRRIEPAAAGIRGLHSPFTAVIDFAAVCRALAADIAAAGGEVRTATEVTGLTERPDEVVVTTSRGTVTAGLVLACGGLQSDRIAAFTGDRGDLRIVPFRGSWLELTGPSAALVRGNVYPVPDPSLPFLGVHATRGIDGRVLAGPNAVLAGAREGYHRGAFDRTDLVATLGFGGFWRLAARHAVSGARELFHDRVRRAAVAELRSYLPDVRDEDVIDGPTGVRAQAVSAGGSLVDDFTLDTSPRIVHVRNAPSPAATASLAIADLLVDELDQRIRA